MQFPTLQPQHSALLKVGLALLPLLAALLLLYRHMKSQAAYANAMNAIADAARNGENVHVQTAFFTSAKYTADADRTQ